jgi:peptidoglycan/LPS O-acetylase OafA/YrhL
MAKQPRTRRVEQRDNANRAALRGDAARSGSDDRAEDSQAGSDRYSVLSGLRGLAALGVFAMHAYALVRFPQVWPGHPTLSFLLAWPMKMGWAGVDVFFTLSAFLLALPFVRAHLDGTAPPGLRDYSTRRAMRILPAYAAQLVILLVLIWLGVALQDISQPVTAARVLVQPFFLYDIGWPHVLAMQWPLVGSWWTLPVELGFYMMLPLLARLLRPGRWKWLLLFVAFAWAWRALLLWTQPYTPPIVFLVEHLPGRIDQFVIGMLAAYAVCRAPPLLDRVVGRRADVLFVVAALVFLALPALGYINGRMVGAEPELQPLLIGWHSYASLAVAGMLFAASRATARLSSIVGSQPLRLLGRISYGFYLWHLPVLMWLYANGGEELAGGPLAFMLFGFLFSLAAAIVSWSVVEGPALRLASRWTSPARARMRTPVPVRAP